MLHPHLPLLPHPLGKPFKHDLDWHHKRPHHREGRRRAAGADVLPCACDGDNLSHFTFLLLVLRHSARHVHGRNTFIGTVAWRDVSRFPRQNESRWKMQTATTLNTTAATNQTPPFRMRNYCAEPFSIVACWIFLLSCIRTMGKKLKERQLMCLYEGNRALNVDVGCILWALFFDFFHLKGYLMVWILDSNWHYTRGIILKGFTNRFLEGFSNSSLRLMRIDLWVQLQIVWLTTW